MKKSISLSTNLYKIVSVVLYVELAIAVVVTGLLIVTIFSDEESLMSAWPISINTENSIIEIGPQSDLVGSVELRTGRGEIQFTSTNILYYLLKILESVFGIGVAIAITILLRKIINTITNGDPFTALNSKRIRYIAWFFTAILPYDILKSLLYRYFIMDNTVLENARFGRLDELFGNSTEVPTVWLDIDISLWPLAVALLLFILAKVFGSGTEINEENKSFI